MLNIKNSINEEINKKINKKSPQTSKLTFQAAQEPNSKQVQEQKILSNASQISEFSLSNKKTKNKKSSIKQVPIQEQREEITLEQSTSQICLRSEQPTEQLTKEVTSYSNKDEITDCSNKQIIFNTLNLCVENILVGKEQQVDNKINFYPLVLNNHCIYLKINNVLFNGLSDVTEGNLSFYYKLTMQYNEDNEHIFNLFNRLDTTLMNFNKKTKYKSIVKNNKFIEFRIIEKTKQNISKDFITNIYINNINKCEEMKMNEFVENFNKNDEISLIIEIIGFLENVNKQVLRPLIHVDQMLVKKSNIIRCNKLKECAFKNENDDIMDYDEWILTVI